MARRTSTVSTPSEGTSALKTGGGGLASFRRLSKRMSMWGALGKALTEKEKPKPVVPKVKLENTYRLEPDPSMTFNTARVRRMMNNVLNAQLQGKEYDPKTTSMLASKISDTIKHKVKLMNFKRHKVVVYVTIGTVSGQGITAASLCLWDTKTDDFASVTYENSSLFAIANVYATYYE
ncbi:dynein light chain Tctex-type protein 2B-like [Ptychodera flava]|uniref:dynein light chain Tctex-type protein 2B-like n=1 Tax=Ptychodera flava TaxID=63121 RepID=UPI00396A9D17